MTQTKNAHAAKEAESRKTHVVKDAEKNTPVAEQSNKMQVKLKSDPNADSRTIFKSDFDTAKHIAVNPADLKEERTTPLRKSA
jgi:hypothetical protein